MYQYPYYILYPYYVLYPFCVLNHILRPTDVPISLLCPVSFLCFKPYIASNRCTDILTMSCILSVFYTIYCVQQMYRYPYYVLYPICVLDHILRPTDVPISLLCPVSSLCFIPYIASNRCTDILTMSCILSVF